jgi:hypothetical protein
MKTVTIDELLSWAFVHELPKGGGVDGLDNMNSAWRRLEASSWGKILNFAELGAMIDAGRSDGANYFIEQGEPHEDAVEVGRAVAALGCCDVHVPEGWNCLTDWADTAGLADRAVLDVAARYRARTAARRAQGIVSLVIGTAILAREPGFVAEQPKVRMVERDGKPAWFAMRAIRLPDETFHSMEVDGRDPRSRKPFRDAYRKYEFSDNRAPTSWGGWTIRYGSRPCGALRPS